MARLIDCPLSVGLATFDKLVRQGEFTDSLAEAVRKDPARAVAALNTEFFSVRPYRGNGPEKAAEQRADLAVSDWVAEMTQFYREVFDREVDLSNVQIPAEQPGFGWALIMLGRLTLNQIWAKCQERFPTHSYLGDDLDRAVPKHDRQLSATYANRFRDRVEADEENSNLSANVLTERKIDGITLPERLMLELWYHWRTGGHLDLENVTLCSGSRRSDGHVPHVSWGAGKLYVSYYLPDYCDGRFRTRSAV